MSDPLFPDESIEIRFRRIEKQLKEVQNTPRVANISTITGGIQSDTVNTSESTSSLLFTNLATVGPTVNAQVLGTGRLLIMAAAQVTFTPATSGGPHGGHMAVSIFGPGLTITLIRVSIGNVPVALDVTFTQSAIAVASGLNAGTYTLQMKYLSLSGATAPVTYANRTLAVQPL